MNGTNPIEIGNIVLILLGVVLIGSGPLIVVRTTQSLLSRRKKAEKIGVFGYLSDGLNYVIGILFFVAGILFVLNNLRGNPLA